jgi:hypothetical protein
MPPSPSLLICRMGLNALPSPIARKKVLGCDLNRQGQGGKHRLSKGQQGRSREWSRHPWATSAPEVRVKDAERARLLLDSEPHSLTSRTHSHQSLKPAYRGTRPPGHQGLPRAGRPGPGWSRRPGGDCRVPLVAVHKPGSSHTHPAPRAPPVGIGVVARGRHRVSGTAGRTPRETETSVSHGLSGWKVRP